MTISAAQAPGFIHGVSGGPNVDLGMYSAILYKYIVRGF